ncbi:MAG: protoglobin domain-containing protein [Vulcanococcus sp.]|jgi:rsbT co-antagonist protein RsbR
METSISSISKRTVQEYLDLYGITEKDVEELKAIGGKIDPAIDSMLDQFYEWMGRYQEMMAYFRDDGTLAHVKKMQRRYWQIFFSGSINESYVNDRYKIGAIHAQIDLPVAIYFAGINMLYPMLRDHSIEITKHESNKNISGDAAIKLLHLDAALVCTAFTDKRDQMIAENSRAVMEMSTPVTEIWEGILLLPVVGIVDSRRSEEIMNSVLHAISTRNAREFILDISGVGVVDTAVANYLIRITKAASLMGCESTISGISPAIAQTIVQLGIDVDSVRSTATMMDALSKAFRRRGIEMNSTPMAR